VRVVLQEGKYHQIRRMVAATGNMSLGVHREQIGELSLEGLAPGTWRDLTKAELEHLWTAKPLANCSEEFVHEPVRQKKKKHLRKRFPDQEPLPSDKKQPRKTKATPRK
jgi:hypothetical protein